MASKQSLRSEFASRHLSDNARGKDKELATVSGFLKRLQLAPDAITPGERPDFGVSFGGGALLIGLELTLLNADVHGTRGSPERRLHSKWKKVAELLRDRLLHEPEPLPNVYGSVFFRNPDMSALDQLDRAQFCEEIVATLRRTALSEAGSQIIVFDPAAAPFLTHAVDRLYVRVFPSERGLHWWCAHLQSGVVPDSANAVRGAVAEKQHKARSYDWGATEERWLLIYAAGEGLADLAVLVEDPEITTPSPFTRIFLWDRFSETIRCLSPEFAAVLTQGHTLYLRPLPASVRLYLKGSRSEA